MPGTRPKLLHMALAMVLGAGMDQSQRLVGEQLRYQLENAHKNIRGGKPSRAAHYKRLAKKRANARARSAKK